MPRLLALSLAWLYIGVTDYRFSSVMVSSIRESRKEEAEIQKRLEG